MGLQVTETFAVESVSFPSEIPVDGLLLEMVNPVDEDHACSHCLVQDKDAVFVSYVP